MKRVAQIYIEGVRLDLFEDEQIQINSSIQTIKDISKVFNDFTQSFTVPASENNNIVFQHFYNSEVILRENTFIDHQLKRSARIELDGTLFRDGKIALEKANLKDGKPYSYQCTFYGELTALKDLFGETEMNEVDWSAYNHNYSYAEIKQRIEDWANEYDVRYPLVSSNRYWQYNNPSTPAENIDTPAGAIEWTELFPALKVKRILEAFETQFDIEFIGSWKDDPRFNKAFGLFKNTNAYAYTTPAYDIDFLSFITGTDYASSEVDLIANTIRLQYVQYQVFNQTTDWGNHIISVSTSNASDQNITWYIDVYENGQLLTSVASTGNASEELVNIDNINQVSLDKTYNFQFRSDAPLTIDLQIDYVFLLPASSGIPAIPTNVYVLECDQITTATLQNLSANAPDMTVAKYFANLLKQFNLTCYGVGDGKYVLETVEEWYSKGTIYNITEYVDVTTIDVERIPLYRKIEFKYQPSKSLTNRFFASTFLREYGDLLATYQYEGGEYKIELDFEHLLFSKFTDTSLQVGYLLDEDLKPYVPKPIILYEEGVTQSTPQITANFYLTDGTVTDLISAHTRFGNVWLNSGDFKSLSWGAEIDPYLETPIIDSLYEEYYSDYIENLYNFRNRRVKVMAVFPLSILTGLDLNDRVVIRDKRYIIDTLTTNLTTGESKLELLLDFRDVKPEGETIINPPIFVPDVPVPPASNCINYYVKYPKECLGQPCNITDVTTPSITGVTITPSVINQPQYVEICIPDNPTPIKPLVNEEYYEPKPNKEIFIRREVQPTYIANEIGSNRTITIRFEFCNGIIVEQNFNQESKITE